MSMHRYTCFGLCIHSELQLPELPPGDSAADVVVRYAKLDTASVGDPSVSRRLWADENEVRILWKPVGSVLIRHGREILVDPLSNVEERIVRLVVLGVSMGILLHQRGYFTLHASAVAIGGGIVGFIGAKGAGKSTTAAALYARGHRLVADDVLAVDLQDDDVEAVPGLPALRLWPDAVASALGEDAERLPRLNPNLSKRVRRATTGFQDTPLPLKAIYVLDYVSEEASAPTIDAMPAREAFLQLVTHSYALRLIGTPAAGRDHLEQCTQLAQRVPVRRLKRGAALERLPDVARLIEEDVHDVLQTGS